MTREFAGTLRERILIERLVEERTAMGLQEAAWVPVCRALAAIEPDGAGAEAEGQALSAMPRFRVTMRPRVGIEVGQRVSWGAVRLAIRQLFENPLDKGRIVLRCEQVRT